MTYYAIASDAPGAGTPYPFPVAVSLTQWLETRTPEQLAEILRHRPETTDPPPPPADLRVLAGRLATFGPVAAAAHRLPAPAIEVIEVLQLLGPEPPGTRTDLARWLGRRPDDADLASVLDLLARRGLVWPDGDRLRMVEPLYRTVAHPLQLGPPATELLAGLPAATLRAIATTLGLRPPSRKQDAVTAIAAALGDGDRVRELVAGAGAAERAALQELAANGPVDADQGWYNYYGYRPDPRLGWALARGLAVNAGPGAPVVPREVAVALRGPGWHAPFTPQPPALPLAEADPAAVEREAAAAGSAAVAQLTALLERMDATPVALLKAGGVGVKELRRLAKELGTDEATVRLWLELAWEAKLVAPARAGARSAARARSAASTRKGSRGRTTTTPTDAAVLLPTAAYDEWAATEPADRLAALLPVWADLPAAPLAGPVDQDEKPPAALLRELNPRPVTAARRHSLGLAASLPAGQGAVAPDPAALAAAVAWHAPLALDTDPFAVRLVAGAWREGELLGVLAHGTLTSLGHALRAVRSDGGTTVAGPATGPVPDLGEACRTLLPSAVSEAIFQADLTAVVPGTPASALAELLDAAADREARGGAVTWRFGAGSVRRALDAGRSAEDLLAALRERAAGQRLPQPLEYLVQDVARRHGAIRVRPVACVLYAEDPALVSEIASARALRSLGLSVVAPTVLGSTEPVAETLAALRTAGYAPVAESASGAPEIEKVERRRARGPARRRGPGPAPAPAPAGPDPLALATKLLATPVPRERSEPSAQERQREERWELAAAGLVPLPEEAELAENVATDIEQFASHLDTDQRRLLVYAISTFSSIDIYYQDHRGATRSQVIEPRDLDGDDLLAWCPEHEDVEVFELHRIASVALA